jgi:ADP-ribose pyrophosphatase YjhB (NUDIX family)
MRRVISRILPILEHTLAFILNLVGAKTVGVRALVIDPQGRILLVRHTYQSGWLTPGGGVINGESPQEAIRRELMEEVGINTNEPLELFGVYKNNWRGRHDYPILFVVRHFDGIPYPADKAEISDVGWFDVNALPAEVTPKTRVRLAEYKAGRQLRDSW